MSSWRPLVEVLSSVDEMPLASDPHAAASAQPQAHSSHASEDAASTAAGQSVYGRQQARGRVPTHASFNTFADDGENTAVKEAEQMRSTAYQEGMELARQQSEALALRYRQSIDEIARIKEHVVRSSEHDLVRLALTIAREVLMADVPGRQHFTERMVEHALTLMGDAQSMALRVSPQDMLALRQHKPELMRRPGLQWVEDVSIAMGGVVVEADRGKLDATISGRLQAMAQTLLGESTDASS